MGYFSSGTEGLDYELAVCKKCVHYKDKPVCAVLDAHFLFNYEECNNPNSILHIFIPMNEKGFNEQCRMFKETIWMQFGYFLCF